MSSMFCRLLYLSEKPLSTAALIVFWGQYSCLLQLISSGNMAQAIVNNRHYDSSFTQTITNKPCHHCIDALYCNVLTFSGSEYEAPDSGCAFIWEGCLCWWCHFRLKLLFLCNYLRLCPFVYVSNSSIHSDQAFVWYCLWSPCGSWWMDWTF